MDLQPIAKPYSEEYKLYKFVFFKCIGNVFAKGKSKFGFKTIESEIYGIKYFCSRFQLQKLHFDFF